MPLTDMNINKMIVGCPWRHEQKIYLQVYVLLSSFFECVLLFLMFSSKILFMCGLLSAGCISC